MAKSKSASSKNPMAPSKRNRNTVVKMAPNSHAFHHFMVLAVSITAIIYGVPIVWEDYVQPFVSTYASEGSWIAQSSAIILMFAICGAVGYAMQLIVNNGLKVLHSEN